MSAFYDPKNFSTLKRLILDLFSSSKAGYAILYFYSGYLHLIYQSVCNLILLSKTPRVYTGCIYVAILQCVF